MAKSKPKTFRRDGDVAFAYNPADEVRLRFNGWVEDKPAPAPTGDTEAKKTARKTDK